MFLSTLSRIYSDVSISTLITATPAAPPATPALVDAIATKVPVAPAD